MFKVKVERSFSHSGYQLWILHHTNNQTFVVEPVELKFNKLERGYILPTPTLMIDMGDEGSSFLKALVEGIMEAGLTPNVSLDNAKQVLALENHIKDLSEVLKVLIRK